MEQSLQPFCKDTRRHHGTWYLYKKLPDRCRKSDRKMAMVHASLVFPVLSALKWLTEHGQQKKHIQWKDLSRWMAVTEKEWCYYSNYYLRLLG